MSQWYPMENSGTDRLWSYVAISRCRAASSVTDWMIGSYGKRSLGKYICVTSRWVNAVPKTESGCGRAARR